MIAICTPPARSATAPGPPDTAPLPGRRGRVGWSVRVDWPDGTHTLTGWTPHRARAQRKARALARFWRLGPIRPCCYQIVGVDREHWRAHARLRRCALARCP